MSTQAKSSPPQGATAIPALAAPAYALAQTAVIPGMRGGRGPICPDKET